MPLARLWNRRLTGSAACGLLAAALTFGIGQGPARAQDETAGRTDQRIINRILTGIGFQRPGSGPSINYSERSPLVIPPSRDLPPPEANAAERNPAWPADPDIKRRQDAARGNWRRPAAGYGDFTDEESRPLSREELARGTVSRTNRPTTPGAPSTEDSRLKPNELGYKGDLFNLRTMFKGNAPESAKFTGEPARTTLTQPPAGYQTPSANHAYGVGPEKPKAVVEDVAARDIR